MITIKSASERETEALGERLAGLLRGTEVLALFGGLGMGKPPLQGGLQRGWA